MNPIAKIANRVKSSVCKAIIEAVSDDNEIQLVKVAGMDNDVQSGIERIQDYGITSNPPIGSGAVVLYLGGNKDHGIVVKTDSGEFRIQSLKSGEVCIYSQHGQKILLDENGDVVFNDGTDFAAGFNDLKSGFDNLKSQLNAAIGVINSHVHSGVTTGPASSGPLVTPAVLATASIDSAKIEEIKLP